MKKHSVAVLLLSGGILLNVLLALAQAPAGSIGRAERTSSISTSAGSAKICARCIRAHMEFLASDALRGRGSGTPDELVAATYIAAQFRAYGVEPAGDDGGYLQRAPILRQKFTSPPLLRVGASQEMPPWIYGRDFIVSQLSQTEFFGPLQKIDAGEEDGKEIEIKPGAIVLVLNNDADRFEMRQTALRAESEGAVAALMAYPDEPETFPGDAELPVLPPELEGESRRIMGGNANLLELSPVASKIIGRLADGTELRFGGPASAEKGSTWNVLGMLWGSDPKLRRSAVVLSAHLDHLGIGPPVEGDNIYNGADDDASGVSAVLEFARILASGPRPRRTVIFALFGSEETGGLGSTYFSEHPPLALADTAVDLEFEMIGRPDPAVPDDDVWLTGWERSDLGPTLKSHGAEVVPDPHTAQNFFARSDNYVLAKKGVVAQTIGSFGLHEDYHQPSDDLAHIDFKHMDVVISGLLVPIEWLVNADYVPVWKKGGRP